MFSHYNKVISYKIGDLQGHVSVCNSDSAPHKVCYMISEVVFEIGPVCPTCLTIDILEEVVLLISKVSISEDIRIHSDTVTLRDLLHTKT